MRAEPWLTAIWRGDGNGIILVTTESNNVYALDGVTGKTMWQRALGKPAPRSALPCGNIDPLGITGTPAIDPRRSTASQVARTNAVSLGRRMARPVSDRPRNTASPAARGRT